MAAQTQTRRPWFTPMALLGGVTAAWMALWLGLDFLLTFSGGAEPFLTRLTGYSAGDVQQALGNLPEVVVAILGVVITVISIVLQLSATRYTPRVTEMFFRDRTNLAVIGFFVVASVHCIWATLAVHGAFLPHIFVLSTLALMSCSILILIPYFAYVFAFLDPERIVARLQRQCLDEALGRRGVSLEVRQERVLQGVEQLCDVAVNAISQKDRIIASRSVDALRDLVLGYTHQKARLSPEWFSIGALLQRNQDFVAMARRSVDQLADEKVWLEWKVLRQYQSIATESMNRLRDIAQLVAIDTRYVGERAVQAGDARLLSLVLKFFNTYLRATINCADVRSAYNILHQYRLLGEALLAAGWNDALLELARHFKYYGLTANARGLAFINETAAYDLCSLCEVAHKQRMPQHEELLEVFLEVDKQPETEAQEQSLRGVRKAQIKLATYYLVQEEEALARKVWGDMEHEKPERMRSIREEMLAVVNEDFWEVIDRGYNFDYLEPARRRQLDRFFAWFADLRNL